jgi:release factor glutamine methyltransferase
MNTRRINWPRLRIDLTALNMNPFTINQCLQLAKEIALVSDSARLDIELLLTHLLQKSRTWLFTWPDYRLTEKQTEDFLKMLERRKKGEPIAHITGQREFWSLPLQVNPSTLIPRPDTEVLVETALQIFATDSPDQKRKCLDLGTGTGAIVLALASEKKFWDFVAVDFSEDAVALAISNQQHLAFNHVTIFQSNWFEKIPAQTFDLIVSNPPYIDPQDSHLTQGDLQFEPRSALVADEKGLADIKHIIAEAKKYLSSNGFLLLEHGYDQAAAVRELLDQNGYTNIETKKDFGGNDRVTFGQHIVTLCPSLEE